MATTNRTSAVSRQVEVFNRAADRTCELIKSLYGVSYDVPVLSDSAAESKDIKSLLSSPLEKLGHSASRRHLGAAGSLFLLRKLLPSPPSDPIPAYKAKMSRDQEPNGAFLDTVRREIPHLFREGWDRNYERYVQRVVISKNACLESKREDGGARSHVNATIGQSDFWDMCLGKTDMELSPYRKVKVLDDGGKHRIVTIQSALAHVLLPLHLLLYDHLSLQPWLLRGDAKISSLTGFTRKPGEVFVSGDYESATDNFVLPHSEAILTAIFARSTHLPLSIRETALRSLRSVLRFDGGAQLEQRSGQLMGNFLSFPLLCITNYLGLVHALGWQRVRSLPLRINGDDIVFRATKGEFTKWADSVKESGLVLSKGKTLVHRHHFSINSTFFSTGRRSIPYLVPVLRSATLFGNIPSATAEASLMGRLRACVWGFRGSDRTLVASSFLRAHRKLFLTIRGSINRAHNFRISPQALSEAGLLARELTYLSAPPPLDAATPTDPEVSDLVGFRSFRRSSVQSSYRNLSDRIFSRHCINNTWSKEDRTRPVLARIARIPDPPKRDPPARRAVFWPDKTQSWQSTPSNIKRMFYRCGLMGLPDRPCESAQRARAWRTLRETFQKAPNSPPKIMVPAILSKAAAVRPGTTPRFLTGGQVRLN